VVVEAANMKSKFKFVWEEFEGRMDFERILKLVKLSSVIP
jgi:hypothetical protein